MQAIEWWLRLQHTPGIGPVEQRRLLERYGSVEAIFTEGVEDPELSEKVRQKLKTYHQDRCDRDLEWREQEGGEIICCEDSAYPPRLAELNDRPTILYLRGEAQLLHSPQIGVVGSRNASRMGLETASDFSGYLASVGITITSGLALGIDAASHEGALKAEGETIAVIGTGADRVYPARNRELAHQIVDSGGLIVSEFPVGTAPVSGNFPKRNRIISGLSLGVLVIEAALKSGSLITARLASEQGREVFAIPGSIHNPLAHGCHQLIRQGAKLVESGADILEELYNQLQDQLNIPNYAADKMQSGSDEAIHSKMGPEDKQILNAIDDFPTSMDQIIGRCGLDTATVSSHLLQLELAGYIATVAGGYCRTKMR